MVAPLPHTPVSGEASSGIFKTPRAATTPTIAIRAATIEVASPAARNRRSSSSGRGDGRCCGDRGYGFCGIRAPYVPRFLNGTRREAAVTGSGRQVSGAAEGPCCARCSRLIFCQILRDIPVVSTSISLTVSSTTGSVDCSAQRAAAFDTMVSSSLQ